MKAYEFYCHDAREGSYLIGILPERRKIPARITLESIMNWGRGILGDNLDLSNLSFVQVRLRETTG